MMSRSVRPCHGRTGVGAQLAPYVGLDGAVIGMEMFGASAPLKGRDGADCAGARQGMDPGRWSVWLTQLRSLAKLAKLGPAEPEF